MWRLPTLLPPLEIGEAHLWNALCLPTSDDLGALRLVVTSSEQERANRLATEALRRRYLQAHALLHLLLRAYLKTEHAELAYHVNGKPFLRVPQMRPQIEFNMSHTGEYVLIALARGYQVGVDVETIRPLSDLESLITECCTQRERKYLASLPTGARLAAFYQLWTRKEALLKMQGIGLGVKLSSVEVSEEVKGATLINLPSNIVAEKDYVGALALSGLGGLPKLMQFNAQWQNTSA